MTAPVATAPAPEATPPATTESVPAVPAPGTTVTIDEARELAKQVSEAAVAEAVAKVREQFIEEARQSPGFGRRGLMSARGVSAIPEGVITDGEELAKLSEKQFEHAAEAVWETVYPFNTLPRFS